MKPAEYVEIRKQLGLTQSELARKLEVSRPTIARREASDGKVTREAAISLSALFENVELSHKDRSCE